MHVRQEKVGVREVIRVGLGGRMVRVWGVGMARGWGSGMVRVWKVRWSGLGSRDRLGLGRWDGWGLGGGFEAVSHISFYSVTTCIFPDILSPKSSFNFPVDFWAVGAGKSWCGGDRLQPYTISTTVSTSKTPVAQRKDAVCPGFKHKNSSI